MKIQILDGDSSLTFKITFYLNIARYIPKRQKKLFFIKNEQNGEKLKNKNKKLFGSNQTKKRENKTEIGVLLLMVIKVLLIKVIKTLNFRI